MDACEKKDTGRRVISALGHTIPAYRNMNMRPAYNTVAYNQFIKGIVDSHGRIIECVRCDQSHKEVPNAGKK